MKFRNILSAAVSSMVLLSSAVFAQSAAEKVLPSSRSFGIDMNDCASIAESSLKESDDIMVYSFGYDVFEEFIKKPTREILEQQQDDVITSILTKIDSSDGCIKREIINKEPIQVYEGDEGELKIGNLPVYSSLIDLVLDKNSLNKILTENSIIGKIDDVMILDIQNMPVTIWMRVNQENYFITVDEMIDDYIMRDNKNMYVYRLYSYLDYCEKFGSKDAKLIINGVDVTSGNYVKIQYSGAYVPFRAIMENLGAKIEWDSERKVALIFYDEKKYVFAPNQFSLIESETGNNILITPPGGIYYYCNIIRDSIILNNNAMQAVLRLMGARINIDYENMVVEIIR